MTSGIIASLMAPYRTYSRAIEVAASAADIFEVVEGIGGRRGWLFANSLWQIRAHIDGLLGGAGARGREDDDHLRTGDIVDFWRVEEFEPDKRLRLRAEMRVPGRGWLEIECQPVSQRRTQLRCTAIFEPCGISGTLYWAAFYPAHAVIFRGLPRAIAVQAERIARHKRRQSPDKSAATALSS